MGGRSALKALWMTDCSLQPIPASPPLFFFFFSVLLFEAVSGFSRGFTWLLRSPASLALIVNLWKCQHMRKETTSIPQQRKIHLKMVSVRSKKPIYNICDPHRLRSPHCVADSFTDRLIYDIPLSSFQASAWRRHWNGEPRKLDWRGHRNGEPQQLKEDIEAMCSCSLKKRTKKDVHDGVWRKYWNEEPLQLEGNTVSQIRTTSPSKISYFEWVFYSMFIS